jgi:uncharacterized protein
MVTVDPARIDSEVVSAPLRVRLEGEVRPHGELFEITGRSASEGLVACARCLGEVEWKNSEDFSVRYRRPVSHALEAEVGLDDDDLEVVFIDGGEFDLDELAAEQALLGLPMRSLCDPDCAGLCPRCGGNRNVEGACACEPEVDPRWNALADLAGTKKDS